MDVDHVAFAGLRKFDGRRTRWLHAAGDRPDRRPRRALPQATAPSASPATARTWTPTWSRRSRATASSRSPAAEWRNAELDFDSLAGLMRSLAAPPPRPGLKLVRGEPGRDDAAPAGRPTRRRRAAAATAPTCCGSGTSARRPTSARPTLDEHVRLVARDLRASDRSATGACPRTGSPGQFAPLDRLDGDIDALSARLASVRTLAYVANRADWLRRPARTGRAARARWRTGSPTRCTSG